MNWETPLRFLLSPGNDHDAIHAERLMKGLDLSVSTMLGDKDYGAQKFRQKPDFDWGRLCDPAQKQRQSAMAGGLSPINEEIKKTLKRAILRQKEMS